MATQIINVSGVASERLVLTANTTLTLKGGYDGQLFTLTVEQDSTGGWSLTATNVNNLTSPSGTPFALTAQTLSFDAADNAWNPVAAAGGPITGTVTSAHIPYASGANVLSDTGFNYTSPPQIYAISGNVTYSFGVITGSTVAFNASNSVTNAHVILQLGSGTDEELSLQSGSGFTNTQTGGSITLAGGSAAVVIEAGAAPSVSGSQLGIGSTHQTTVGAAGGASAQPATPLGYLLWNVGGTVVAIPYHLAS